MKMRVGSDIRIERIRPEVDCGEFTVKRIMGETCSVDATIFRYGHEPLACSVKWRKIGERRFFDAPMEVINPGLDRWSGQFTLTDNARYEFLIEAWTDRYAAWLAELKKRVEANQAKEVARTLLEGAALCEELARAATGSHRKEILRLIADLRRPNQPPQQVVGIAERRELLTTIRRLQQKQEGNMKPRLVMSDRPRARFGAWYEMFVRSQGSVTGRSGTLRDAELRLEDVSAMGFDVVYLAPIHPIGHTNRKGRDNDLKAGPGDPGSPWAIGNQDGGHTAIDPALGTIEDFDHFVMAAKQRGMEVAMDFAIQCSPDHPWVNEHPDWFYKRPDGTIKYAENPPKQYEDTYPINFDTKDWKNLWRELKRVIVFWVGHGVKIFRVDNPHTKPLRFWRWLIDDIQGDHPEVIFLSEAFTRPPMMQALAKIGFTQSYTYFTWRNTKAELTDYLTELIQPEMQDYFRPNFFVNTPDILPEILQRGGQPAFKLRLILAATLSPSYGIYSGFELCENEAKPGTEEYKDSEKYQIKVRDWNRAGNIKAFIQRVNAIRRENPALHYFSNLRFYGSDNDQILFYCKRTVDRSNSILIAANLDPFHPQACTVHVPLGEFGLKNGAKFKVSDLLTGADYVWSDTNYVRLDPNVEPAHVLRLA